MPQFIEFLHSLGFNVSESSSPILLFAFLVCILSIISLLSFINILIYFGILYLSDNKVLLGKLSKWPYLLKIMFIYKQTRLGFLISELFLFLASQCTIIYLCSRLILKLINI